MKKEEQEMEVIVYGEIDLRKIPKEIFDAFIAALEEDSRRHRNEKTPLLLLLIFHGQTYIHSRFV